LQTIPQGRARSSVFKGLNRIEVIHLVSFFGPLNIYVTACLLWPTREGGRQLATRGELRATAPCARPVGEALARSHALVASALNR
jgi:hypothetical protein